MRSMQKYKVEIDFLQKPSIDNPQFESHIVTNIEFGEGWVQLDVVIDGAEDVQYVYNKDSIFALTLQPIKE